MITERELARTREVLAEREHRKAMAERAAKVASGEHSIPLRCGICRSPSIESGVKEDEGLLVCLACGRRTPEGVAHRLRRQEIRAYLDRGVA